MFGEEKIGHGGTEKGGEEWKSSRVEELKGERVKG